MKLIFLSIVLMLCITLPSFAQKPPAKFGDVSIEDLKMTTYSPDSSAEAVVLMDYGVSQMRFNEDKGFYLEFERLKRIKILNKEGLHWADFAIDLFHSGSGEEKLVGLKAVTYNLANGKIVTSKMKSESVFKEKFNKNFDRTKIALPDVIVGSVIEITYTITSDSEFIYNFQDWEFQSTIPIVWSEYRASIPEYFSYDKYTQGYLSFDINEQNKAATSITFRGESQESRLGNTSSVAQSRTLNLEETRHRWVVKNAPAFRAEPYLTTPNDYISKINFELAYVKFPNSPIKNYSGTWDDINKLYASNENFLGNVTGNGFLKKNVEEITAGLTSPEQKINAICNYVKSSVLWNGYSSDFAPTSFRKVLEEKKGNSSEINLLLASLLDKAGFSVSPVLISTRDHGFIREQIAVSSQFNYTLCLVRYDDKQILLDATEPYLPNNLLPERCLNGRGFVVTKEGPHWINLTSGEKTRTVTIANLNLDSEGHLAGEMTVEHTGYDALSHRKKYLSLGETDYLKSFTSSKEWLVSKSTFEGLKDVHKPFKEKYDLSMENMVTVSGDILYLNPYLSLQIDENPFKSESREYPVDYGFTREQIFVISINIPEGYVVDELPPTKSVSLPANASKFVYNVATSGNKIMLTSTLAVNRSLFTQIDYPALREFFNQVVAKQTQQVVLRKKTN